MMNLTGNEDNQQKTTQAYNVFKNVYRKTNYIPDRSIYYYYCTIDSLQKLKVIWDPNRKKSVCLRQ